MKASDYIVEFLISKGITDVFGYPGGMVTQLMDSFAKYSNQKYFLDYCKYSPKINKIFLKIRVFKVYF